MDAVGIVHVVALHDDDDPEMVENEYIVNDEMDASLFGPKSMTCLSQAPPRQVRRLTSPTRHKRTPTMIERGRSLAQLPGATHLAATTRDAAQPPEPAARQTTDSQGVAQLVTGSTEHFATRNDAARQVEFT